MEAYKTTHTQTADKRVTFTYDYRNRRVRKQVYQWDPGAQDWAVQSGSERRFLWDGGRLLLERLPFTSTYRKYTWGLDLAGPNGAVACGVPAGRVSDAGHGDPALRGAGRSARCRWYIG